MIKEYTFDLYDNISIFVVSTFDTDYILVMESDAEKAKKELIKDGYNVSHASM